MTASSLRRLPDWQLRLEAFVRARAAMPFAWGRNDCATFAAAAVEAMTGEHLMPHLRQHQHARTALAVLQAEGGLRAIAGQALGSEVTPAFAAVGDVVLVAIGKRVALGICNGETVLGPARNGVLAISMAQAIAAWKVE